MNQFVENPDPARVCSKSFPNLLYSPYLISRDLLISLLLLANFLVVLLVDDVGKPPYIITKPFSLVSLQRIVRKLNSGRADKQIPGVRDNSHSAGTGRIFIH